MCVNKDVQTYMRCMILFFSFLFDLLVLLLLLIKKSFEYLLHSNYDYDSIVQ